MPKFDNLREKVSPYSPIAKVLLGVISVALVTYGVYDEVALAAIIGGLTAISTTFWELYDRFFKKD